jgi:soluble lytic murein transglycosylase-like protein
VLGLNGFGRHGDAIEAFVPSEQRWKKIGEFETAVAFRAIAGALQTCDAAIARITADDLVGDEVEGIGVPTQASTGLFEGKNLRFRGAVTGLSNAASVRSFGDVVPVVCRNLSGGESFSLRFSDQILYGIQAGTVWQTATKPGDSGAVIFDADGLPVGLHIAVTTSDYPVTTSVCTPIQTVLDALGVSLQADAASFSSPSVGIVHVDTATTSAAPASPIASIAPAPPAVRATAASFVAGTVSPLLDADQIGIRSFDQFDVSIRSILEPHNPFGGVTWQLTRSGLVVNGRLDRSPGTLVTIPRVWSMFGEQICAAARQYRVPVELIMATICTESSGKPEAIRFEPGYVDDTRTPGKISVGLMQTLISSARDALDDSSVDRASLLDPQTSIDAGAAFISRQRVSTRLDPPLVACAYNAGHLELQEGMANRWKIRQYPIGTGAHADRFVQWFNDCFAFFSSNPASALGDAPSFYCQFGGRQL